jgi:succinate dehydrogenase / fumarate reductase, cytochrome b subunit
MSSLGKKYLMALSGIVLVGFAIGHMVGNLQMFLDPHYINLYAHKLQSLGPALWLIRGFLLLCVVTHIVTAVLLVLENRKARPAAYDVKSKLQASFASRTMKYSGIIILAFIVYHLLHFTVKSTDARFHELTPFILKDGTAVHDVYSMVALGFQCPSISIFYIISVGLLSLHLAHGVSSMFQSLGLRNALWRGRLDKVAVAVGVLLFVGFASIPAAVLAGKIQPLTGASCTPCAVTAPACPATH